MRKAKWWMAAFFAVILVAGLVLTGCAQKPTETPAPTESAKVLDVKVVDTDEYQGFIPSELMAKAGDTIELRVTNEDYKARTGSPLSNAHPISVVGPGMSRGILELNPGQTKSVTFTVQEGTYRFYCSEGACDIHTDLAGVIEVTK